MFRGNLPALDTATSNEKRKGRLLYPATRVLRAGGTERFALLEFFALTYAITWGLIALFLHFQLHFSIYFGPFNMNIPFYRIYWHLCVYAPAISAMAVILRRWGLAGIRGYTRRLFRWRIGAKWYLVVLVGVPALYVLDRAIFAAFGGTAPAYPVHPWYLILPTVLLSLVANPAPVEELGWRGYALPLLQRRFSAFQSSMILGVVWFCWHLPAFFLLGGTYTFAALPFYFLQALALSIIMTGLYNATGGNILLAFLFHWQYHDPFQLRAFPNDLYIVTALLVIAALASVLLFGSRRWGREKCTEVFALPGMWAPESEQSG